MSDALAIQLRRNRSIRLWLFIVAAMVFGTVVVGGVTRLTESGLSIVEWKPLTGTVPPLSERDWEAEFEKYKAIPQYQALNRGMTVADFKVIYWWEWVHRQSARLTGLVFLLPFLWFLWRGALGLSLRIRLTLILALGAIQAGVGWWMVSSGLSGRLDVSQYRLAIHLTLACLIFVALVWTALRLVPRPDVEAPRRIRTSALVLLLLVLVQIYLGALVAGLDAGLSYNTWPLMDGRFIPPWSGLFAMEPWWVNLFENVLTVQFNHRMMAYLLFLVAVWHAIDAARSARKQAFAGAHALAAAITIQAVIGIVALINQTPISLAIVHQIMAMVVLTIAVVHAERLVARRRSGAPAVAAAQAAA
jgi:cytochrome c oxidase assembly protein subunit 15